MHQRIDGEVFLALMTDPETGGVKVRTIDCLQVEEVITDADDETRPLYYQRKWMPRAFAYGTGDQSTAAYTSAGEQRSDYYADVANADLPNKPLSSRKRV